MVQQDERVKIIDFLMITIGCAIYGLGLDVVNIPNHLAEGGVTGITLILRALLGINPALSTILINIPLIYFGYRLLGRKALIYTIYGTLNLSLWIYIWQQTPIHLSVNHDMLIAAILAGLAGGAGSGLVYRFGGTTGGTDVIARVLEKRFRIPMGQSMFALDAIVLTISLVYIDVLHMMYTLITVYVFSRIVTVTQAGAYSERGLLIISSKHDEIADAIILKLDRGISFINMTGAYSKVEQKLIYCVVAANELNTVKNIIEQIDPAAFTSIIDVNEAIGEGFTYPKK